MAARAHDVAPAPGSLSFEYIDRKALLGLETRVRRTGRETSDCNRIGGRTATLRICHDVFKRRTSRPCRTSWRCTRRHVRMIVSVAQHSSSGMSLSNILFAGEQATARICHKPSVVVGFLTTPKRAPRVRTQAADRLVSSGCPCFGRVSSSCCCFAVRPRRCRRRRRRRRRRART